AASPGLGPESGRGGASVAITGVSKLLLIEKGVDVALSVGSAADAWALAPAIARATNPPKSSLRGQRNEGFMNFSFSQTKNKCDALSGRRICLRLRNAFLHFYSDGHNAVGTESSDYRGDPRASCRFLPSVVQCWIWLPPPLQV